MPFAAHMRRERSPQTSSPSDRKPRASRRQWNAEVPRRIATDISSYTSDVLRQKKLRAIAISAGVVLCIASFFWPKISTVATVLLLYVTFEYLLVTRDSLAVTREHLDLFQHQLQRQERVVLHFDLTCKERGLFLRVSNLGLSNFLLRTVHVRKPDDSALDCDVHRVVESGKTDEIRLPDDLFRDPAIAFDMDLEFTLRYLGLDGAAETAPKCCNVFLGLENTPVEVMDGINGLWDTRCPKCRVPTCTSLQGLNTFEAASARRKQLTEDLGMTCPDHKSEWLLTVDAVEEQRRERRNRRTL